ncbi:hypothetical protein FACS1894206_04270 [Deltaproteobacteria bacterium]|nr:hypothetical protein FACS1894206_04270 [Deltaproteobacteria bacterium]
MLSTAPCGFFRFPAGSAAPVGQTACGIYYHIFHADTSLCHNIRLAVISGIKEKISLGKLLRETMNNDIANITDTITGLRKRR